MSRRLDQNPQRVDVDGHAMVVVTSEEYEGLLGSRRQLGAQNARLRAMKHELQHTADRLALVEAFMQTVGHGESPDSDDVVDEKMSICADATCIRCQVLGIVGGKPEAHTEH